MPLPDDRLPERCQELDFPEAVLLVNPVETEFKGEVTPISRLFGFLFFLYKTACSQITINVFFLCLMKHQNGVRSIWASSKSKLVLLH